MAALCTNIKFPDSSFSAFELLKTKTPVLSGNGNPETTREELLQYFHKTFTLYEKLFEVLRDDETFYQQPEKLRHPLIFYWGHTAVFFINKLKLGKYIEKRINEKYESTCAVGVDEMSWDDLTPSHYNWPTTQQLRDYRNLVREEVDHVIRHMDCKLPINWENPLWTIMMGIEHERIHLETSSVLIRQLPIEYVRPHALWPRCPEMRTNPDDVPVNSLIDIPGGKVKLGKSYDHPLYGWDVEYGHQESTVSSFKASKYLVSNKEYYEFMVDHGYETQQWWGEEGWRFVTFRNARHPVFWVPQRDNNNNSVVCYKYRCMCEEIDMPWDWPVDVNYIEAKAFCNWKSHKLGKKIRLPTEEEWNRLRDYSYPEHSSSLSSSSSYMNGPVLEQYVKTQHDTTVLEKELSSLSLSSSMSSSSSSSSSSSTINDQPYWKNAPGNINLEYYASSCPIDKYEFAYGLYDIIGNVWQHSETPVMAYPGFRFHPLYDDFSIPTFDTRHNMILGGSWASTGNEATRLARYAFRRHFYQHAGFRYIESDEEVIVPTETAMCENDPAVCKYIDSHYSKYTTSSSSPSSTISTPTTSTTSSTSTPTTVVPTSSSALLSQFSLPNHCDILLQICKSSIEQTNIHCSRAADIGCAAGRMTFELASLFDYVLGLDQSTRFIRIGSQLQYHHSLQYTLKTEGELESYHEINIHNIIPKFDNIVNKIEFMQGDACNLATKYNNFDLILASNLIEELAEPIKFLSTIHERINNNGLLVLASTYKWNSSLTIKENWVGGKKEHGESLTSRDGVEGILSQHFKLISSPMNIPVMIRNNNRSYDYSISEVMVWQRLNH